MLKKMNERDVGQSNDMHDLIKEKQESLQDKWFGMHISRDGFPPGLVLPINGHC